MNDPGPEFGSPIENEFTRLATRTLENYPGLREEARVELMERLSSQEPSSRTSAVTDAVRRLEKVTPDSWKETSVIIAITWLILTGFIIWQWYSLSSERPSSEKAEQTLHGARSIILAAMTTILLLLAFALSAGRHPSRRVNGLASGLGPMLDLRDDCWLFGVGALAPFAWYSLFTGMSLFGHAADGFHAIAFVVLIPLTLLQVTRSRISKRFHFVGMGLRHDWIGWCAVGIAALLIPIASIPSDFNHRFAIIFLATCGLLLLWFIWEAGAIQFAPKSGALPGVLMARAATPAILVVIGLLLVAYVTLHLMK